MIDGKEFNYEPSQTVVGMEYSLPDLVRKVMSGQIVTTSDSYYESDYGEVDFDNGDPTHDPAFDLSDATEILEETERALEDSKLIKEEVSSEETIDDETKENGENEPESE